MHIVHICTNLYTLCMSAKNICIKIRCLHNTQNIRTYITFLLHPHRWFWVTPRAGHTHVYVHACTYPKLENLNLKFTLIYFLIKFFTVICFEVILTRGILSDRIEDFNALFIGCSWVKKKTYMPGRFSHWRISFEEIF